MEKYLSILKIGFQQELVYKAQFITWRLRNIIQILVFFYLWRSVFETQNSVFGYTTATIASYTFLLIVIRSIVMSTKANDVSGYISSGELSNYLLKPISFFKYIVVRDMPVKILNFAFSIIEISVLLFIIKPDVFIQNNITQIVIFFLTLFIAVSIFFLVVMIASSVPFWIPEAGWGFQFLIINIFVDFLSGAFFPLDVFPTAIKNFLMLTPFPYIIFVPIKTYLGDLNAFQNLQNIVVGIIWVFILFIAFKKVWSKGLKAYEGVGR